MMKTLKLMGMVMACAGFCACSSSDDDSGTMVEEKTVTVNAVEGSNDKLTDNLLVYKLTSNDEAMVYGNNGEVVSVTIPTNIVWGGNTYKVTKIGAKAFYNLETLTCVAVPNSVKSVGDEAFYDCPELASITISKNLKSIGDFAFENCRNLTSILIPNSVTSIGREAFYNCTGLTSVIVPYNVAILEESVFHNCSGLTSVTIPNSVTKIESEVFYGCIVLKDIYMQAATPPKSCRPPYGYVFDDYSATIHVPSGCKAIYSKTYPWSEFKNIVES